MILIEESYSTWDSNEIEIPTYIKRYDENSNLIYFERHNIDESIISSFAYDKTNRLTEELIAINRPYGQPGEELKKEYVYNDIGYSILTYQLRIIDDSLTSEKFKNGGLISVEDYYSKHPRETNRLIYIEEFTINNLGKIMTVKKNDLATNSISLDEYIYEENKISIFHYSLLGTNKTLKEKSIQKFDDNSRIVLDKNIVLIDGVESIANYSEYTYWQDDDFYRTDYKKTKSNDGMEIIEKYDSNGNVLQQTNSYGDRTIYLNSYNEFNLLESITGIYVQDDYHKLRSKKLLKYN